MLVVSFEVSDASSPDFSNGERVGPGRGPCCRTRRCRHGALNGQKGQRSRCRRRLHRAWHCAHRTVHLSSHCDLHAGPRHRTHGLLASPRTPRHVFRVRVSPASQRRPTRRRFHFCQQKNRAKCAIFILIFYLCSWPQSHDSSFLSSHFPPPQHSPSFFDSHLPPSQHPSFLLK